MENRFWKKAAAASGRSHHAESTRAGAARRACFMLALVVLVCAALTAWPTAARAELTQDADGYYLIDDYAKLKAFATLVEGWTEDTGPNARLTAEITITANDTAWTPIGKESKKFKGVFDGQGHTITA